MNATKKATNFGGRPVTRKSEPGKRVHLSLAVPQPLKHGLEKAAKASAWSVSNEAAHRLQASLDNDRAIGADVRNASLTMTVAFAQAGRRRAHEKGIGDNWPRDHDCYLAAMTNVLRALLRDAPSDIPPTLTRAACESVLATWTGSKEWNNAR